MASSIVDLLVPQEANGISSNEGTTLRKYPRFTPGYTVVEKEKTTGYEYEHLKPFFPDVTWPPLEEVPYSDKGLLGDPEYKDLLAEATDVFDYTPKIGTEIHGVNLKALTNAQKNDLARLISYRGVVFFRGQKDFQVEDQLELGRYWGTLHKHATTSVVKGLDEVHSVYYDKNTLDQRALFTPAHLWHADVTYEIQPPSYTLLIILRGPPRGAGGDTIWSSQYAAYDVLSTPMQQYLEGLTALHTSEEQAAGSRAAGRPVRREAVTTEHPMVRTHPVTGWKSLFVNPGFVKQIVGVPKMESDAILKYLYDIVVTTQELHLRFSWEEHTVAIWDNRICTHTGTFGFAPHVRHLLRVTTQGERPVFDPNSKSQEEDLNEKTGRAPVNKNGARQSNYND